MSVDYSFVNRLIEEKADLDWKRNKLGDFKNSEAFARLPWQDQELLNTQAHIITMYSSVLAERIARGREAELNDE